MNRVANRLILRRRLYVLGVLATAALLAGLDLSRTTASASPQPRSDDKQISKVVSRYLTDEHLIRKNRPSDEEISHRTFTTYLKTLDPMKIYFLQSDVDDFAKSENALDDQIKTGHTEFAYTVFDRFLQRVDERVKLVDQLLAEKPDFTVDEEIQTDPKLISYAKDDAEMRDRWRKRIKYELLVKKADELDKKDEESAKKDGKSDTDAAKSADTEEPKAPVKETTPEEKISKRYHSFAKRMHQTKSEDLLERYLTSLTESFDPHTSYMSPSTLDNFDINMSLHLEGIGAALEYELEDGTTKVSRLIPGGPAEKDGRLKPEDRVIGVGQGTGGEFVDTADMNLNEVVDLIRGKAGSVVRLKVQSATGATKVIDITRASIELKDQEARSVIFEEGHKPNGQPYKIGVIDLPSFYMDMNAARQGVSDYKSTTRDVQKLLDDFNAKGVDAVILDLRRNGGGSLVEAVSLTGLFIDEGTVVQVKDSNGRVQKYDDNDKGVAWAGPLVVLQSKFSASASEIFAGAIQDYNRGLVVGDRTSHGKGTVQQLMDVSRAYFGDIPNAQPMGALKITIQQFYRPDGDSTQNRGVVSDIELPSLTTHLDVGESDLDYALKFDHIKPATYTKTDMVDPTLIDELKSRSEKRVEVSSDFRKHQKEIDEYVALKDRKTVPLNEEKFLKERADLNTEKEEEKQFEDLDNPNRPVVKRDYYFNEAINITLDYLQLSKKLAVGDGISSRSRSISNGQ